LKKWAGWMAGEASSTERNVEPRALTKHRQRGSVVVLTVVAVALCLALSACGASGRTGAGKGTVSGVVSMTLGSTSVRPTHAVTVELVTSHKVVAEQRVVRMADFRFVVRPGRYRIAIRGVKSCMGAATVQAGVKTTAVIRCTLVQALSSVAFSTLPLSGRITTKADALKRLTPTTKGSNRIEVVKTTWGEYYAVRKLHHNLDTVTGSTTPAWVVCVSGGRYVADSGASYTSECEVEFTANAGTVERLYGHGWPAWFAQLSGR
jgi:hypothetical protein